MKVIKPQLFVYESHMTMKNLEGTEIISWPNEDIDEFIERCDDIAGDSICINPEIYYHKDVIYKIVEKLNEKS